MMTTTYLNNNITNLCSDNLVISERRKEAKKKVIKTKKKPHNPNIL
ncbi:MAG: hypothetical protein NY202_05890 [Mollicutes bacterium UO1]